ncbi:MAG: hypothetical protein SPK63_05115 [Eubacteriales bacterium]|nr:hypothetical protein [Eubacteriales bacterium]
MQKTRKSKFLAIIAAIILCLPLALLLTACGGTKKQVNTNSKEMYALSAISSAIYLQHEQNSVVKSMKAVNLAQTQTEKPASITDEDLAGTESCLTMFGDVIKNNGYTQTVEKNTDSSEELKKYNFVMTISIPNLSNIGVYKLYYDEIATETQVEIEDEETETEISTTLEGVLIANETHFKVEGKKTIETEGDNTEYSIEFKTYFDENNYVVVEQSSENNEHEYEYEIYKKGVKVQKIEIEFEKENNKTELKFELVNINSGIKEKTIYKIKSADNELFEISLNKNGEIQTFQAKIVEGKINFMF